MRTSRPISLDVERSEPRAGSPAFNDLSDGVRGKLLDNHHPGSAEPEVVRAVRDLTNAARFPARSAAALTRPARFCMALASASALCFGFTTSSLAETACPSKFGIYAFIALQYKFVLKPAFAGAKEPRSLQAVLHRTFFLFPVERRPARAADSSLNSALRFRRVSELPWLRGSRVLRPVYNRADLQFSCCTAKVGNSFARLPKSVISSRLGASMRTS